MLAAHPNHFEILTAVAFLRTRMPDGQKVRLLAGPGAGHWALCARAVAGNAVTRDAIDTAGFRFADVRDPHSPDFLPGGAKFIDPYVLAK